MVTDGFVRNILAPTLLVIFLGLLSPAFMAAFVIVSTDFLSAEEPEEVLWILELFGGFDGLPSDLTAFFLQVVPALIGAICYRSGEEKTLNWTGRFALILLIFGACISTAVILFLNPEDQDQIFALEMGREGLQLLESGSEASLRVATTYILLFTGLQVRIGKGKE